MSHLLSSTTTNTVQVTPGYQDGVLTSTLSALPHNGSQITSRHHLAPLQVKRTSLILGTLDGTLPSNVTASSRQWLCSRKGSEDILDQNPGSEILKRLHVASHRVKVPCIWHYYSDPTMFLLRKPSVRCLIEAYAMDQKTQKHLGTYLGCRLKSIIGRF